MSDHAEKQRASQAEEQKLIEEIQSLIKLKNLKVNLTDQSGKQVETMSMASGYTGYTPCAYMIC